ncbi:hypothetical protein CROQUDRAFT_42747 [Cronartium quercuum f. sp. fusiforme G11]|uniref:Uncharacterized protein n=1 Tax=Cronartium quercuum f. sp. fusiforme G11 TaxID=708437 RepID=A0A9P6NNR8_9BASI|nr:hypothetical protein CROQUDRAFT_42747 [Cronartium quercuum f. sp. fusiforme G11]
MWTEWLAVLLGNKTVVKNYAVSGATVDHSLWRSASQKADMGGEVEVFICQKNKIDSPTTLTTLFFGNNDISASKIESNDQPSLAPAAERFLVETEKLINVGLTNLLVLTPAFSGAAEREFGTVLWKGLNDLKRRYHNLKFITANLAELYNAIKGSPSSFGYRSLDSCLPRNNDVTKACKDPDYHLYWLFSHPQQYTHKLHAEYIMKISETCTVSDSKHDSTDPLSTGASSPEDGPITSVSVPENCKHVPVPPQPKCF